MSIKLLTTCSYDWEHLKQSYFKYINSKSTVLEIGASTVEKTKEISRKVKKVIGVEYYKNRLPKDFSNIEYRLGDWQKLTKIVKCNSIDVAISSHVIEHVPNDLKAINELYLVLKKSGVAIINTPNRQRLVRRIIEIFTGPKKFPDWEHVREYTYNDLIKLLNKSKFKKWTITPVVLGLHTGTYFKLYLKKVPKTFVDYANYWEVELKK